MAAIRVLVKNGEQSIVPIRFCRAVTGDPARDAPDIDDRGFAMGTRPGTWGSSDAKGAMVGIRQGDTVRVKVLREDIDTRAPLYAVSTDTAIARVVSPVGGGPIGNDGIFEIEGVADRANRNVAIEIHFGAANGPVIGELEPHIFAEISVRVCFHLVSILGTGTARNAAAARTLLDGINDIYRPCGIQFTLRDADIVNEEVRRRPGGGDPRDEYRNRATGNWALVSSLPPGMTTFERAGEITSHEDWGGAGGPDEYIEFDTVLSLNSKASRINIYCVSNCWDLKNNRHPWVGLCYVGGRFRGLAIVDSADKYDLAHEIGHYLNRHHSDRSSATNADTGNQNIWLVRRLLFSVYPPAAPPYRHDVGYGVRASGTGQYGALVSLKKLPGVFTGQEGETAEYRRRARLV